MESLQNHNTIKALEELSGQYERQLKTLGLDLSDLPDDCSVLMHEYAEIKNSTKLHDLKQTYLEEFYYDKQKERIKNFEVIKKLENDIRSLENDIIQENCEIKDITTFINSVNKRIASSADLEKNYDLIQKKIEGIQKIEEKLQVPKDIDIDDLIMKIETLEVRKAAAKK